MTQVINLIHFIPLRQENYDCLAKVKSQGLPKMAE